ncbi:hypothetical protein C7H19_15535 [Aphanothece hegewaldii CCALA 016]|uniref:Uncharacterized protein n=1 Tax=Aphanothece hegewaldii CCALA 016 TaxID=2107694 RepID=A0A2T1LVA6_9CHRO|nr:hypothetical protein [Aphanothece hegewaldii]PSF35653.1 hypothetical protein C7H19_15535 [Aphanothece hegewaldii CCALA 016]
MKKDLLTLLGCSSSIALTLLTVPSAYANNVPVQEYVFTSANEGTEILAVEHPTENLIADQADFANCSCQDINMSDAEGERAIALYGCDCAAHRLLVQNLNKNQNL